MGRMLCFTIYTELKGEPNLDFLIYFKNIISWKLNRDWEEERKNISKFSIYNDKSKSEKIDFQMKEKIE